MSLSLNHQTVGGRIDDTAHQYGKQPLPWVMFTVRTSAMVWDRFGNRAISPVTERVVIQGEENVKLHRVRIRQGVEVLVVGQVVPARVVAADADIRGTVCLASLLQFPGEL